MNKTIFEGKWKQIHGKSEEWWTLINELDLSKVDKAVVKLDRYVVILHMKFGYTKQHAKDEIDKHIKEIEAKEIELNLQAS